MSFLAYKLWEMRNPNTKYLLDNKKTMHAYSIFSKYQSGLVLKSSTIKKILNYKLSLVGSYGWVKGKEIFLKNFDQEEIKLLLKKEEIERIIRQKNEKKYLLIPENLYLKNNLIKITLTLAKYDKSKLKNKEKLEKIKRKDQKKLDKNYY